MAGQEQIVVVDPVLPGTAAVGIVSLEARYATAKPENDALSGLGTRLHWDADQLELLAFGDGFATGNPEPWSSTVISAIRALRRSVRIVAAKIKDCRAEPGPARGIRREP